MTTQPHSPTAEAGIIAALALGEPEAVAMIASSGLTPASFHVAAHRVVFGEVLAMHAEGKPINAGTIGERLQTRGLLASVGGWPAFSAMTSDPPLSPVLADYCREVAALETRRKLANCALALSEAATANPDAVPELLARLLETQTGAANCRTWKRVVADAERRAADVIAGRSSEEAGVLTFGLLDCDRIFRQPRRGEMIVIAARPSCGKSSLMRQIVAANARNGAITLVESLEVSADDIADSLAATAAGIAWTDLASAHHADQADYIAAIHRFDLGNLHVFDRDRSLAAIVARAKAIHSAGGLDLLAIDYLGLIRDCEQAGRGETKASAIGRVTKALKSLALELGCTILLLAQLNRQSAQDGNREPRLSDLRDSGDIEQDADRVIFIHRPDEDPLTRRAQKDTDDATDCPRFFQNVIQAKGRSVGTGIVSTYFRRTVTRFEPIAREAE